MAQDQYEFIMQGNQPVKKPMIPGTGGNSMKSRIILVVIGAFILIMGAIGVNAIVNSGPDNKQQLLELAQQQTELIRVAEIGVKNSSGLQAKNLAITTELTLTTERNTLVAALKTQKVKVNDKTLKAKADSKTDRALTTAQQNNRFDEEFLKTIQEDLKEYQQNMKAAYNTTTNKKLREALKLQYANANIIIGIKPET